MNNNKIKFAYIKEHWELRGNVIYSKRTNKPNTFSSQGKDNRRAQKIKVNGKSCSVYIHDAVWMLHHNKPLPDGDFHVHHVDLDPQNNAPDNLVLMSHRTHQFYHKYISGSKGYRYVAGCKARPWYVFIRIPIGRYIQKYFATEAEAIAEVARHRAPILKAFKELGLPL